MNEPLGTERRSVQNPIIKYATEVGWTYVTEEEALQMRGGENRLLFSQLFMAQMQRLNPDFMTDKMAEDLIRRLERIPARIEGNQMVWEYLKGLKTAFVPSEKRERNVRLLDSETIANNVFQVTDEFVFSNGSHTVRLDVVFLINGCPLLLVETKAAHKLEGLNEAFKQVQRYHRQCPELLAMLQIYSLTHLIKYYYSATWNLSSKFLLNWKDECCGNFEELVKAFFEPGRVIKMIQEFILFTRSDDELRKVVLRPHQMQAVAKIVQRAADPSKQRGLIWHTQGSGKTYTMIVAAQQIMANQAFENPTVILLVDRNELESQLFGHISAVGIEHAEVALRKSHLRQLLRSDRRGLIVSMIHKFDGMPANINLRNNIFVLIDEAHRTTTGVLGNYLMGALPNASFIGFTGTPIDKTAYGQGTFVKFGKDDPPHGYLDKYSIAESIEDGTTVPLHYALAPNELQVDRETLEKEFFALTEAEGMSDIEQLNQILERAVTLRNMLKSPDRMRRVAKFVAEYFREHIEPLGYKAFLVAVDREACARYKALLDEHLPAEYSEVVYSAGVNDGPELAKFHLSKEAEKRVRKKFRDPNALPKILIVTEKLLTGFDAPVLFCMYLDKPMRDHVLLQAIARVNRPYEADGKAKACGLVLDFVGIFANLEKALAFDSQDIEGVVRDIELLKNDFASKMESARENYLSILRGYYGDKAVEAVLLHFQEEQKRQAFYQFFKGLSESYDILSPDAFLRPYITDMETLARMYRMLREAYEPGIDVDRDFSQKVARLVQEQTAGSRIRDTIEVYQINERTLELIEQSQVSETERVFNLLKSIEKEVREHGKIQPYLKSIGEKAAMIIELFKSGQKKTLEALEELKKLVAEINDARAEQQIKNLPMEIFTIYWVLRNEGISEPEDRANQMTETFQQYPHFRTSSAQERAVKSKLFAMLLKSGLKDMERVKTISETIMRVLKADAV